MAEGVMEPSPAACRSGSTWRRVRSSADSLPPSTLIRRAEGANKCKCGLRTPGCASALPVKQAETLKHIRVCPRHKSIARSVPKHKLLRFCTVPFLCLVLYSWLCLIEREERLHPPHKARCNHQHRLAAHVPRPAWLPRAALLLDGRATRHHRRRPDAFIRAHAQQQGPLLAP